MFSWGIFSYLHNFIAGVVYGLNLHAGVGVGPAPGCEPGRWTDLVVGEEVKYGGQTAVKIVEGSGKTVCQSKNAK